jgi:hypothetical protein
MLLRHVRIPIPPLQLKVIAKNLQKNSSNLNNKDGKVKNPLKIMHLHKSPEE